VLEVDDPPQRVRIELDPVGTPAVWCVGRTNVMCGPSDVNIGFG
jgi:hypothetical protein